MVEELIRRVVGRSQSETLRDRCLVVALAVQDTFGGELMVRRTPGGADHFTNALLDGNYDFAADHDSGEPEVVESSHLLRTVPRVATQLAPFAYRFKVELERRLPILQNHHVVIQDLAENPGSYARPDFSTVLLHGSRRFDSTTFAPGQTFWLKAGSGTIMAKATLTRWVAGSREDWADTDLRSICQNTSLAESSSTWDRLANSAASHFLLIWLESPEVLDIPLYPKARGYGQSVVSLASAGDQIAWLCASSCDPPRASRSRGGKRAERPSRFRWEHGLDIEVSTAIDERMSPRGGLRERISVINHCLREYFHYVGDTDPTAHFSPDELTALAEIVEDVHGDRRISKQQLAADARRVAWAMADEGRDAAVDLLTVAEIVETLTFAEHLALLEELSAVMTRLPKRHARGPSLSFVRFAPPGNRIDTVDGDDY